MPTASVFGVVTEVKLKECGGKRTHPSCFKGGCKAVFGVQSENLATLTDGGWVIISILRYC